jgi:hypothetical protein
VLIAVSPYHLSTREPPAMVSLLLASRVVTLLPAPSNDDVEKAVRTASRVREYAELARSWEWARKLFDAGVIAPKHGPLTPMEDLQRVWEWIRDDDRYAPLRAFMRLGPDGNEEGYLRAVAADILKAGPDPGLSVPLTAGLDRFASRVGAFAARSQAVSVAQNLEWDLGTVLTTFALPVLVQADGERLLHAREILRAPLDVLRGVLGRLLETGEHDTGEAVRSVAPAADGCAKAFEVWRDELFADAGADRVRVVESIAMITIVSLPVDAVLRSGVAALAAIGADVRFPRSALARTVARGETEGRRVLAMIVRVVGSRRG